MANPKKLVIESSLRLIPCRYRKEIETVLVEAKSTFSLSPIRYRLTIQVTWVLLGMKILLGWFKIFQKVDISTLITN